MYPRSTIKTYKGAGANPVGAEQPFIYKDPPKAIFTRKYEPVNEFEIQAFIRPDSEFADPTRVNESIKYFARGQNPMVEISYSNAGGAQTNQSLGNFQASNPYKIEVVRPPLYPIETLVPISAPRIHQNYAIQTNPNIAPITASGFYDKNLVKNMTSTQTAGGVVRINPSLDYLHQIGQDGRDSVKTNVDPLRGTMQSSTSLNIDLTRDSTGKLRDLAVREMPLNYGVNAAHNFSNVVIFDPKSNTSIDVSSTIKEKQYVAVSAAAGLPIIFNTSDGKEIKLKDYTYSVVQPNIGNTQLVIQVDQPEVHLERNMPLFAAQTNLIMPGFNHDIDRTQMETFELTNKAPMTSANSNINFNTGYDDFGSRMKQENVKLDKLSVFGDTADRFSSNSQIGQRMGMSTSGMIGKKIY